MGETGENIPCSRMLTDYIKPLGQEHGDYDRDIKTALLCFIFGQSVKPSDSPLHPANDVPWGLGGLRTAKRNAGTHPEQPLLDAGSGHPAVAQLY